MDNLALEALNRMKNKRHTLVKEEKKRKPNNYISLLFTRTLLSIILVLLCAIFVNISDANLLTFKNYFFNETLSFSKMNELYSKYFGPIVKEKINTPIPVFENTKNYKNITQENDSFKVELTNNIFSFLQSGVVVFLGEKEGFGKTMIVQGIDGVDIWYSNLENYTVTIYDYVEKENIVGEFKDKEAILTFIEDGNYISYENYIS